MVCQHPLFKQITDEQIPNKRPMSSLITSEIQPIQLPSINPEAEVALPLNVSDDHNVSFETILKMSLQSSKTEDSTTNNIHPEIKKNISCLKSCAEAPLIIDPELMKIYKKHGECFIWNI